MKSNFIIILLYISFIYVSTYRQILRERYEGLIPQHSRYPYNYGRLKGFPQPPSGTWTAPIDHHFLHDNRINIQEIYSSANEVIKSTPASSHDIQEWDYNLDEHICSKLPSLTRAQLILCNKFTNVTSAAAIGLAMAVKECRRQLENQRWNCTSLLAYENNPHAAPIMNKGYSESAFVHAIAAAGITHSVARACAAGRLTDCSCGQVKGRRAWKWSGCHDNTKFGARFSRRFLDIREKAQDVLSYTHLFNNEVGRKVVRRNRGIHCKCHGMSGSCEVQTCWKAVPKFRNVGNLLHKKYLGEKASSQTVFGNSPGRMNFKSIRRKISLESPLLYAEKSPTFCENNYRLGIKGTFGRVCNRTSTKEDSCDIMCCGRGHVIKKRKYVKKCECRFKWCCNVTCKDCIYEDWVAVCK